MALLLARRSKRGIGGGVGSGSTALAEVLALASPRATSLANSSIAVQTKEADAHSGMQVYKNDTSGVANG